MVSITNNLRINQAKATRAIKSKVINQHMAHSHSSSALSALKVAEENIRISLLNKSNFNKKHIRVLMVIKICRFIENSY